MLKKDKRVDAYIAKSATFAQPILKHFRQLVHEACPEAEESIKWGFPSFDYKGMLCGMASFKQHCAFTFWKAAVMKDKQKLFSLAENAAMGQLGQIKKLSDLPSDKILLEYIKEAARLNEDGIKLPSKPKADAKDLNIPDYFIKTVGKNKNALKTFESFSYSNKKDYVEWVIEAKTEDTRNKRLATAIEWMGEGKPRNWKYLKK